MTSTGTSGAPDTANKTLRRVGGALVVVGLLDIGYMIYCIINKLSYSSSLNIFAVIAGIFLLRQNLRAAKVIAWWAAFLFSGCGGVLLVSPFLIPLDLQRVALRLHPTAMLISLLGASVLLAFFYWVYTQLTSAPVLEARRAAGLAAMPPLGAFALGAVLVITLFGLVTVVTHSAAAHTARQKAQAQYGSEYRYYVTSLNWAGSRGNATLTAYNDSGIKRVRVQW